VSGHFLFCDIAHLSRYHRNPHNQTAITAVNNFATLLANRFNAIVGCTRSWDSPDPDFQVRLTLRKLLRCRLSYRSSSTT